MADRPLIAIAHRAGNHRKLLRRAEEIGADYVEADVRLHRGRLEVRHLKTVRYLPLLYDRWKIFGRRVGFSLAPGWANRLVLSKLLEALEPEMGLMIDLKGDDERLPSSVLSALDDAGSQRRVIVCGQNWRHIDPLLDVPAVTAVHSVGNSHQLVRLFARPNFKTQGISIDQALLSRDVADRLHELAPMLLTWPINSLALLDRVTAFGVDGVICDRMQILQHVVYSRRRDVEPQRAPQGHDVRN
jgi:glycerophosphoryl diester phosphodiesterase